MDEAERTACSAVAETMRRIYAHRLTSTSGGNVSVRDESGIWITAAAVDKGLLTEHDVARIGIDGTLRRGPRPSSEWPFHVAIYQARPDIRAIVHAHAPALVAASLLGERVDTRLLPSCFNACGQLGNTTYLVPGTAELGAALASVFGQGFNCVLMQNHGIVIGAESLFMALCRLEILEMSVRAMFHAREIGKLRSPIVENEIGPQPSPREAQNAQARESDTAAELIHFAGRGNRWQLLQNGRGGLSARCHQNPDFYLATPGLCDFTAIAADQLIAYQLSAPSAAFKGRLNSLLDHPSLVQTLYQMHPDARAVIHGHPPFATAFSLVDVDHLPVTIPESYIVLGHVRIIDPRISTGGMAEQIAAAIDQEHAALIIAHEGVLVTGRSLLEAFDRLEVLESTAESIIHAHRVGTMTALSPAEIQQLEARREAHSISKQHQIE